MGEAEARYAEDEIRSTRAMEDRSVSELEGAQRFLQTMISEAQDAAMAVQGRLSPLLQAERAVNAESKEKMADPRSEFVRTLTEQGERVRDIAGVLRDVLDRLDV